MDDPTSRFITTLGSALYMAHVYIALALTYTTHTLQIYLSYLIPHLPNSIVNGLTQNYYFVVIDEQGNNITGKFMYFYNISKVPNFIRHKLQLNKLVIIYAHFAANYIDFDLLKEDAIFPLAERDLFSIKINPVKPTPKNIPEIDTNDLLAQINDFVDDEEISDQEHEEF